VSNKVVEREGIMSHYFTNDDSIKSEIKKVNVRLKNQSLSFYTDNGVFSKKGLDFGTRSLLETLEPIQGDVLDLGCGYGPIGIYLKKEFPVTVDMVDINKRSLELARKNAVLNEVDVHIIESNGYENITKKYDYIITNPPIRVGKKILYSLLLDAKEYLKENGQLWFVIHKDQGAKTLAKDMEQTYKVEIVNKNKGFYIIKCSRG